MKKILFLTSLTISLAVLTLSCSNDDDANSSCESCMIDGEIAEICDNGNGTFTATNSSETVTITQDDLDALELTAEEYITLVCALGSF
ncbi:MAG: hypothetical protein AAGC43_14245 [Bacteroidota bacterium]